VSESEPFVRWDWVLSHLDEVWARTLEHLQLTGLAVGIGFLIAMVLSLVAIRFRRAYSPITWFAGILYTIPSIAVFALLVPVTGLTTTTAEVGLVCYTLLILVRNIVAGIDAVPDATREAAVAMGFRRWRLLAQIEIPLALPVIIAGVRIATVTTVGLVTVTSLIGQGGYGAFINDGLRRFFNTPLVLGAALSVALAIALDVLLVVAERALTPWARRRTA
jgi:osmoprotectant transport system permease protein